jgi:hypothetical protein
MLRGQTTDGRAVEVLKRSRTAVLVRMLEDDRLRYLPHTAIAHVDHTGGADETAAPLHVQVARVVGAAGFMTPEALIETTGRCEADLAPVTDHLVRAGILARERVGGVLGYTPVDDPG